MPNLMVRISNCSNGKTTNDFIFFKMLKIIAHLNHLFQLAPFRLSLLFLLCSFSLPTELVLEGEIKGQFKFFTTDKLGNIFVITPKNDIQKFDSKGKKISEANFKVMGEVTSIDASNALEIYVFYKDQNKLVYFDNMLNYRGETDLYKTLGVSNLLAICRSYDNGFWFFDPDDFKLKKADKQGSLQSESINISSKADTVLSPQMLVDDGKYVYMKANNDRLVVFDIIGNYIKTIPLEKFTSFQTKDDNIMYSTNNDLYIYNPLIFEKESFKLSMNEKFTNRTFLNIRKEDKRLYLQDSVGVAIYSF